MMRNVVLGAGLALALCGPVSAEIYQHQAPFTTVNLLPGSYDYAQGRCPTGMAIGGGYQFQHMSNGYAGYEDVRIVAQSTAGDTWMLTLHNAGALPLRVSISVLPICMTP